MSPEVVRDGYKRPSVSKLKREPTSRVPLFVKPVESTRSFTRILSYLTDSVFPRGSLRVDEMVLRQSEEEIHSSTRRGIETHPERLTPEVDGGGCKRWSVKTKDGTYLVDFPPYRLVETTNLLRQGQTSECSQVWWTPTFAMGASRVDEVFSH